MKWILLVLTHWAAFAAGAWFMRQFFPRWRQAADEREQLEWEGRFNRKPSESDEDP